MLPDEVDNCLGEIARVMTPGGTCISSYFLLNDETRAGIESRHSFLSFNTRDQSDRCRLHNASIPEAAVALDEGFVQRLHARCGLEIVDVRRGQWWNGAAHDQDVVTAVRR